MGMRKDGYIALFVALIALESVGCVGPPLQSNSNSEAPTRAGRGSREIVQASAPAPSPTSSDPVAKLHTLYREAAERYAKVDSYIVRLTRREQINGKDKPE